MLPPVSIIELNLGINPGGRVQKQFVDACQRRMDKYIPFRPGQEGGSLRLKHIKDGKSITYIMPYAHAQYVGFTTGPVRNYTTPGTGPYWDKKMLSAERESLVKEVQEYIRRKT